MLSGKEVTKTKSFEVVSIRHTPQEDGGYKWVVTIQNLSDFSIRSNEFVDSSKTKLLEKLRKSCSYTVPNRVIKEI